MLKETSRNRITMIKAWVKCWEKKLTQKWIQIWISWISRHIQQIIELKKDNEYKENKAENSTICQKLDWTKDFIYWKNRVNSDEFSWTSKRMIVKFIY